LEQVIGSGGMGIVYKAKDLLKVEANDRDPYVAIKVLGEEFKAHPESFIALQRESRKTQRIAHPNIVSVFDFDRDGDTVFMTMEYMDGKPLDKLLNQYRSTGLPTDDAWEILGCICSALTHAHKEDIIHSDFKPGNVFVTTRGVAKVFDFGIARAVAQIEHHDASGEDKTLFDAGNLGALTPAYASLEMLEGQTPDIRDDLYAVGCVAYELFTGEHPFNKIPADEAERKKLKPKRITTITKRQWRAIEGALAFRRENRTATVDEFYRQIKYKRKPAYQLAASLAILLALFVVIYFQYIKPQPEGPDKNAMRNELEYEIRVDLFKKNIIRLIGDASFTASWESELWSEYQGLRELLDKEDPWLLANTETIYKLYAKKIDELVSGKRYANAKILVTNAYRYTGDTQWLDQQKQLIADAMAGDGREVVVKQPDVINQMPDPQTKQKKAVELFELALKNVNQQLNCQSSLNMQNIDAAVNKLRSLDAARYNSLEPQIVKSLASCIELVGKSMSERAEEYKTEAMRIFNSNRVIAAIKIQARDPCDASLAGLGAKGQRALCRDKLQQGDSGPALVVIPGNNAISTFAMSKYEVSIADVNIFCKMTRECSV
ncbi:MAG TPA: serine/threonine-protein kinase, partial [Gammaproteobacteria bacterium]|nr:serine/threonine-protein kinase [Gammaproteobacteria bacterium]